MKLVKNLLHDLLLTFYFKLYSFGTVVSLKLVMYWFLYDLAQKCDNIMLLWTLIIFSVDGASIFFLEQVPIWVGLLQVVLSGRESTFFRLL